MKVFFCFLNLRLKHVLLNTEMLPFVTLKMENTYYNIVFIIIKPDFRQYY